ncbi:MAG TPA: PilZ domain-containing protein [Gammaproteobacteria bacterium]|nr:PilZ domain-containing protein [Gammaproteobacteria bacterium]
MRSFIRHPSDISIEYQLDEEGARQASEQLHDIGEGGLSFASATRLPVGARVRIRIPHVKPAFEAGGKVVWCRPGRAGWNIGVSFLEASDRYRVRMVEQICYIEHYRAEVLATEGRRISSEQAAREWIERYAAAFPWFDETAASL